MSNNDFQDRLKRLAESAHQPSQAQSTRQAQQTKAPAPNYGLVGAGGAMIAIGTQAVKHANQNYEAIRDSYGIGAAAGLGLAALGAMIFGIVLIYRGVSSRVSPADLHQSGMARPKRQASTRARVVLTLLGAAFGVIACVYLFLGQAALSVGTEKAESFANGAVVIALFLLALSLLFGLVGLFLRGFALWRVPYFFLAGAVITYCVVYFLRIDMLDWPGFAPLLQ